MRYFVTGGTGFIGMELIRMLAGEGNQVHALVRSEKKAEALRHPNIRFFLGDISDPDAIRRAIRGCTHVFHLAGLAKPVSGNPQEFYRVNVDGTENVLQAALENRVERVVFTSTAGVFSPSGDQDDISEGSGRPTGFSTDYARSKALAEEKCQHYIARGLDVVIVNPSRVYGPGLLSEANSLTRIIRSFLWGKWHIIPGNGKSYGNYVFIGDVVAGHLLAMLKGKCGECYILGGENLTFDDLFSTLGLVTGRRPFMVHLPYGVMWFAAGLLSAGSRLAGKEPPISPAWIRRYLQHRRLSVEKAVKDLGYQPVLFAEGARKTIEWLNLSTPDHE